MEGSSPTLRKAHPIAFDAEEAARLSAQEGLGPQSCLAKKSKYGPDSSPETGRARRKSVTFDAVFVQEYPRLIERTKTGDITVSLDWLEQGQQPTPTMRRVKSLEEEKALEPREVQQERSRGLQRLTMPEKLRLANGGKSLLNEAMSANSFDLDGGGDGGGEPPPLLGKIGRAQTCRLPSSGPLVVAEEEPPTAMAKWRSMGGGRARGPGGFGGSAAEGGAGGPGPNASQAAPAGNRSVFPLGRALFSAKGSLASSFGRLASPVLRPPAPPPGPAEPTAGKRRGSVQWDAAESPPAAAPAAPPVGFPSRWRGSVQWEATAADTECASDVRFSESSSEGRASMITVSSASTRSLPSEDFSFGRGSGSGGSVGEFDPERARAFLQSSRSSRASSSSRSLGSGAVQRRGSWSSRSLLS